MSRPRTRESGSMDTGIPVAIVVLLALIALPRLADAAGWALPSWVRAAALVVGVLLIGAALAFGRSGGMASNLSDAELDDLRREYGSSGTDDPPTG